jgi:hypothetical protein
MSTGICGLSHSSAVVVVVVVSFFINSTRPPSLECIYRSLFKTKFVDVAPIGAVIIFWNLS